MPVSSFGARLPVDELAVFVQLLLLHRRAKHNLVPIVQDARLSLGDTHTIDLHTWGIGVSEHMCMCIFNAVGVGGIKDRGVGANDTCQVPLVELSCMVMLNQLSLHPSEIPAE
jgi:hypothetical protein